jgi:hypothetical protein
MDHRNLRIDPGRLRPVGWVFLYADGVPHQETTRQATVARQTPVASSEVSVWSRYEVPTGGFSLALPPSWTRYTKPIPSLEPGLKFAAWGISYEARTPMVIRTQVAG